MTIITRKEYMEGAGQRAKEESAAAHRAYYAQFVSDRTIGAVVRLIGREALLNSKDPHFNDIPLGRWDALVNGLPLAMPMKSAGDYYTLAGGVCIAKEAARQFVERNKDSGHAA